MSGAHRELLAPYETLVDFHDVYSVSLLLIMSQGFTEQIDVCAFDILLGFAGALRDFCRSLRCSVVSRASFMENLREVKYVKYLKHSAFCNI